MEQESFFIGDTELKEVVEMLKSNYGLDFTGYAPTSLRRRISRFQSMFGINTIEGLAFFIEQNPANLQLLLHEITVNTTEMFRDPEVWSYMREHVIPALREFNTIRIWHAGCSTGEEVYSMMILLDESGLLEKSKVYATDINQDVLKLAGEGQFREKDYEIYEENYRLSGGKGGFMDYFEKSADFFTVKKRLKMPLNFKKYNLAGSAPFSKFDIIMCRNVMIYFNSELQSKVLQLFASSLFKNGYLIIGKKEAILRQNGKMTYRVVNAAERVYSLL